MVHAIIFQCDGCGKQKTLLPPRRFQPVPIPNDWVLLKADTRVDGYLIPEAHFHACPDCIGRVFEIAQNDVWHVQVVKCVNPERVE